MKKFLTILILISFILLSSCGKDDILPKDDLFLSGALTSATVQQIEGRWAIVQLKFEGVLSDVPINHVECGRDFFDIKSNGVYREYLFHDMQCIPELNTLNWTLSNGVVTLTDGTTKDQWVITELNANKMVFKYRYNVDNDPELEIIDVICNRYVPPSEIDIYSQTFYQDMTYENSDKILLKWDVYSGYNDFVKYEIYRLGENCDNTNQELIITITDVNQNSFIDLTPPPYAQICYVLKIYTNSGLLGESYPIGVDTSSIIVPHVNLSTPILNANTSVVLNWETYNGYYFSHYEIEVRNYSSGYGGGYGEEKMAVINNIETIQTTIEQPYVENPVFVINVYNIFGSKNQLVVEGQNKQSTNFSRNEILPVNFIARLAYSPNESIIYFTDYNNLYRYNYNTYHIENSFVLNNSSIIFIKVIESSFGTEVFVHEGINIIVFDANLNFKYNLESSVSSPKKLEHTENNYWLITDREKLYSFSRTNNTLNLLSSNNLYNYNFCCSLINVLDIGQNRILVGNATQDHGLKISMDNNGILSSNSVSVSVNTTSEMSDYYLFSKSQQYLINRGDRTVYSTQSYNLITTLNQIFYPSGLNNSGTKILGTNNSPDLSQESNQEKKVKIVSYPDLAEQLYGSKGYPQYVFQNHLGQIVSVSKGFKGQLNYSSNEKDIFVEIIE
jgi:hypothetical protein